MKKNWKPAVKLKRICAVVAAVALLLTGMMIPTTVNAAQQETSNVSRLINVVYDDSRSMFLGGLNAWAQAKYSLEVFSSMMQENDIMNVYFMSQFDGKYGNAAIGRAPLISGISGKDSLKQENIDKIHTTVSKASGTYFGAIDAAYENLKTEGSKYDEKWLVVITDGDSLSNGNDSGVRSDPVGYLNNKFKNTVSDGIEVAYLGIQPSNGNAIVPAVSESVRVYNAAGNKPNSEDGILAKVTEICEEIFQRPPVKSNGGSIDLSIPVSEIVVFAQGSNVSIGNLAGANKFETSSKISAADKKYATTVEADRNVAGTVELSGTVATFTPASGNYFDAGSYNISVTADEYVVYYKPCLDVVLKIRDAQGSIVTDDVIPIGNYSAEYWLTYPENHPRYGDKISTSLFDVTYQLYISTNGGRKERLTANNFYLDIGQNTEISVTASYLNYISSDKAQKFAAVEDFTVEELKVELELHQEKYILSRMKDENEGMTVKVSKDGAPLSGDDWNRCGLELIAEGVDFNVTKNGDSTFTVKPTWKNGDRASTATGEVNFQAVATISDGRKPTHKGAVLGCIEIYDDVTAVKLGVTVDNNNDSLKSDAFNESKPSITVKVDWAGNPLTKEQYEALKKNGLSVKFKDMEKVEVNGKKVPLVEVSEIVFADFKEGEHTTAVIYFKANGDIGDQRTMLDDCDEFTVNATIDREGLVSKGKAEGDLDVTRVYTPFEIILFVLILLFIIGHLPPFKWYLPFRIKYDPYNSAFGRKSPKYAYCYFNPISWITVLLPFCPVITHIKFVWFSGVSKAAPMTLCSRIFSFKGRSCKVLNANTLKDAMRIYIDSPNANGSKDVLKYRSSKLRNDGRVVVTTK